MKAMRKAIEHERKRRAINKLDKRIRVMICKIQEMKGDLLRLKDKYYKLEAELYY